MRLVGFVPPYEVQRQWVYYESDQGANCYALIDKNRKGSKFAAFRYVMSAGHERISLTKALLKVMLDHGYDIFAPAYSFCTLKASMHLFRGCDLHKCSEFILDVCRPAVTDELIRKWVLQAAPADVNAKSLLQWVAVNGKLDLHFDSHAFVALDLLSAYSCYLKGQRHNVETIAYAGKKLLLPLLGVLYHLDYWKAILRDFLEYQHRAHELVRLERKKDYTIGCLETNKDGIDFLAENTIKDAKKFNFSDGAYGFLVASIMTNVARPFYELLFREGDKKEPRYNRQRSPTKLDETRRACQKVVQQCAGLFSVVENRASAMTINEAEEIIDGTDARSLFKQGSMDCTDYYRSRCTTLPTRLKLRTQYKLENLIDDNEEQKEGEEEEAEGEDEGEEEKEERNDEETSDDERDDNEEKSDMMDGKNSFVKEFVFVNVSFLSNFFSFDVSRMTRHENALNYFASC